MRVRRTFVVVAVAALLVLAGCSGAGGGPLDGGSGGDAVEATPAAGDASAGTTVQSGSNSGEQSMSAAADARFRIRTAEASVTVDDFGTARRSLVAETRSLGGYLGSSRQQQHHADNQTWTTGTVVLRVPAENYSVLLDAVRASGDVDRVSTDTRDVTKRVVDLRARLENLKAQRDRLREMYNETDSTEEALAVQERLSEVQTEIEQVQGELQVLEHRVAYSTVTVHLDEQRPDRSAVASRPGIVGAFVSSVYGVVDALHTLALLAAYAIPYLVVFFLPVGAVVYGIRRYRS